ncbi:MAG: lamin tail domain-containing protein [Oscillochloris sp.]|nr:lamin tail domain-containing protein [Oscillochloris sp.]
MSGPTQAASDPISLSCPNRQTTILTGSDAPPNASLIAYLSQRPVGGGSSRQDGSWRIPLDVNERPGTYSVQVKVRGTRTLVGSFTCYVDIPLDLSATPDGAMTAGTSTSALVSETPTSGPSLTTTGTTPTRTTTVTGTRTTTVTGTTTTTVTGTRTTTVTGTRTTTVTGTRTTTVTGTTTTTRTTTAIAKISINEITCRDPDYGGTDDDSEYIELESNDTAAIDLNGWKVVNGSRSNLTYTFPSYIFTVDLNSYTRLYSGMGDDAPDFAEFYWNHTDRIWYSGDQAKLYDASGNLVDSYTVANSNTNCNR